MGRNQRGTVLRCTAIGPLKQKLISMGLIPGVEVTMLRPAPLGDPLEIGLQGYLLSLRSTEADLVEVAIR
ncbi:MAG: hypothetical protein AVO34_05970 [Firmicutes bacterium ML8_F2]|nr:MAG: hypothetical protein AVO34_05970 [Firmicutes bacterium ML8_F2]